MNPTPVDGRPHVPDRRHGSWRRIVWLSVSASTVLALGLVLGSALRHADSAGPGGTAPSAGPATRLVDTPAPSLAGPTLAGPQFDLAALRGRPVLVNVWASWCETCRDELRIIGAAAQRWADQGLAVVGINIRDDDTQARTLLAEAGSASLTIVVDHNGTKAVDWGVRGVPETFLVDRAGRLRVEARGAITEEWLRQWIEPRIAAS